MTELHLCQDDIYRGNLILVNASNALIQNRQPELIPIDEGNEIFMERNAARLLSRLMEAVNSNGTIVPVSGYRSPSEQAKIYNESLIKNGAEFTKRYVAMPYKSEHQTGLAIDLALKQENIDFIRPYFPDEGICKKFRKMAPLYGFIERYPQDKEAITGIAHEPWHFRYVGFPHSKIMSEQGLTLEEYIDKLKSYPYDGKHCFIKNNNQEIEIFYVCLLDIFSIRIGINDNILYQVSGNNDDGVIITIWRNIHE